MLDAALLNFLKNSSDIKSVISNDRIFLGVAPDNVQPPFVTVSIMDGQRTRITPKLMSVSVPVKISIVVNNKDLVRGRNIAEKFLSVLENYRGTLYPIKDVFISANSIAFIDVTNGMRIYGLRIRVEYVEDI